MLFKAIRFSLSMAILASAVTALAAPHLSQDPLAGRPFYNPAADGYTLEFSDQNPRAMSAEVDGTTITFRGFEKIVYVERPVVTAYQTINFYVPEAYFNGGTINGFTAETAPIFLPNAVGGYMPAQAEVPRTGRDGKPNAILRALAKGYVVASVGTRGRTQQNDAGVYLGKAPSAIIDLKCAVRYLRHNDARMPGNTAKIISNGTSAGGALSALLGASGGSADYPVELFRELGAAEAHDAIFAASVYCPITNLEHADAAYEWQFNGLNAYSHKDFSRMTAETFNDRSGGPATLEGNLNAAQTALSAELRTTFPDYLNGLGLKDENGLSLTLDKNGEGSFLDFLKAKLVESANVAKAEGQDIRAGWLRCDAHGNATDVDWQGYIHSEKRAKTPPAFDALDRSAPENSLFGNTTTDACHFTAFAQERDPEHGAMADAASIRLMNAMHYTDNPNAARYFRIRVGTRDRDTSLAVSAMLALKLREHGAQVDYALPWNVPHSGDYDLDALFMWMDAITKVDDRQ